ncbi:nucleotidyltransferase domain-containing protein [Dyadobacter diqingensis]|uniref:nucleotidyltransferase domain-containing protein n=1 Tax=Dyadobacter diqingensis TaxID=2938121 RepID=UPI0020C1EB46|nr:nucleotidyltransferase domain-containing protein [Dyadobacter diqingensis]
MSTRKVPESVARLTEEFVSQMKALYGNRLDKVILFGSYARGENTKDSDVDYLVVLNDDEIRALREISAISAVTSLLGLKYDVWVSAIPFTVNRLSSGETPLGLNVNNEGIVL